jgi:hypothetical protein
MSVVDQNQRKTWLRTILLSPIAFAGGTISGCSSTEAVDDYVREHNILGQRVCNAQSPDVESADVLVRGCPVGEDLFIEGRNQHEEIKKETQEEAL